MISESPRRRFGRRLCVERFEPRLLLAVDFATHEIAAGDELSQGTVYAADLDGDGDTDVLGTSGRQGTVIWYENTDGLGTFGPRQLITNEPNNHAVAVHAVDLDGDDDLDVLSAFSGVDDSEDKIVWYENTDGLGTFGSQRVITTNTLSARSLYAADLDGDGDFDVLSASFYDDKIAWYENTDGLGTFGPQQVITTDAYSAQSVYAADLDGDGDFDVLSACIGDKIAWYENTNGAGSFGEERVISRADNARSVYSADFDGDGDLDVLAAFWFGGIAWYENTDGLGTFGPQQVITTETMWATKVYAGDLDGDGDFDVLSSSRRDDKIAWYENTDATGSFGPQQVIDREANEARDVCAADLDGDGDLDVLSASAFNFGKSIVAWHENLLPRIPGDANRDGFFDSADFVQVFQAGEYEDGIEDNSTWIEGDWDGDFDFTSSDFVVAFETGLYEVKPELNASKIAAAVDWLFTQSDTKGTRRAFVA